eukprot:TRINITY_DN30290_c0_g1_i1.p1 TRINITY_DN30290_c0_g1~~TRINITY_DN30290_c0_g1_i1.p1  ORF type:complete len:758 (-),score=131.82 TRINITY_DN30290_c0_g1_i1:157-2373(-)
MALDMRSYQAECIDRVKAANTIVVLPTGTGKTLVAVKAIDHFREVAPSKRAIFAVPTKALVTQQADYCRTHCKGSPVPARLCGMEMDGWDATKWSKCVRHHQVLVGTAEVFRRALDKAYLRLAEISIIIFDECHNAVGNSPMAAMMKDFVARAPSGPRVLGLTASIVAGGIKKRSDVELKKIELEALLHSKVFCPDTTTSQAQPLSTDERREWQKVACPQENLEEKFGGEVGKFLHDLINDVDPRKMVAEFSKALRRLMHLFCELGLDAFRVGLRDTIIRQLDSHAQDLALSPDARVQGASAARRVGITNLRQKLQSWSELELLKNKYPGLMKAPPHSGKLQVLLNLLRQTLLDLGKGIIFVTQVILTVPLAQIVEKLLPDCQAIGIYRQMNAADQDSATSSFRDGKVKVLVATDVLLEGLNVPDCEWVVRFNEFTTTKSHIQGSGRARSLKAKIFYLENDPDFEKERASMMESVARNPTITFTEELHEARQAKRRRQNEAARGIHPYEEPNGQPVHFFNCLEIVIDWCQQVLKQNFNFEDLFEYAPEDEGGMLSGIKVPWPAGFKTVTCEEIDTHWGGVKMEDILDAGRLAKLVKKDRERRRALFVVAVRMRKAGVLDSNNNPTGMCLASARATCEVQARTPQIKMRNNFPSTNPQVRGGNYVSAVSEWAQRRWPTKIAKDLVTYSEHLSDDGWVSTVRIVPLDKSFTGEPQPSKKSSQHSAARMAYENVAKRTTDA